MQIPKIIHQTWKESSLPSPIEELAARWRRLHPGWEYRLWTDHHNRQLVASHFPDYLAIYDGFEHPIQRADAARYFFLYKFGGVYVDLDYLPLQNMESILGSSEVLFPLEPAEHCRIHDKEIIVSNALMASTPEHPFFEAILSDLEVRHAATYPAGKEILESTGPFMVTRVYHNYVERDRVTLYDSRYFCPLSYLEVERWLAEEDHRLFRRKTQASVAVHLFEGSWWKSKPQTVSYLSMLDQAHSTATDASRIPKTFHLIWKDDEVPEVAEPLLGQLKEFHPDWEIQWWTDETMLSFINTRLPEYADSYVQFPTMIQRCDFFRLSVLFELGGIYLDLDIVLRRPFAEVDADVECFFPCEKVMSPEALQEHGNRDAVRIGNYAIGSIPGHPFLQHVIEAAARNSAVPVTGRNDVLETTGPGLLSTLYHDYLTDHPDANMHLFYPEAGATRSCACERYAAVASCQVGPFGSHLHMGSW